ncbi:serine acetyltransferase [Nocardia huaxiensis]|uniref:serine acetyltransferase n=1 Tax=Nocardia huaxiensis TaxID=2755382 RepID=UPI001E554CCD|nr:serine acetyltransferase [Nocardia huaxiensis]UFS98879.1 serine acetyltransferase [Nocardia huaxiensis]
MIDSKESLRHYLAEDLAAHGLTRWRVHYRLTQRIPHFQRLLRKSEYWANVRTDPIGRVVFTWYQLRTKLLGERMGFTVPRNVFGPGLSIAHVGLLCVNSGAKVGARCRIHQGVTLGNAGAGRWPVIGDDVFIGPNAVVLGATVGNRVEIRAGAVVLRDIPDGAHVAGVPAKIISRTGESPVAEPSLPAPSQP